MVITVIAEPRSGSTNLASWFYHNKNSFTVLYEPLNPKSVKYYNGLPPQNWKYNTQHLFIKEIYAQDKDLKNLIEISDKIILLYRENESEQEESWINSVNTDNWVNQWVFKKKDMVCDEGKIDYFKNLKINFKKDYLDDNQYFKISYEDLYHNNQFQKLLDYIDLDGIKNENFPYGMKYRVNHEIKSII